MSRLHYYIQCQQNLACRLQGILEGLEVLKNESTAKAAQDVLIEIAHETAERLNHNLDSANLPSDGQEGQA